MKTFQLKVVQALFYSTNSIFVPYLPLLLQHRGFNAAETGTWLMLGPFIAMFAQPIAGMISDKIGAVRPLLISLWLLMGICTTVMFVVDDPYITIASLLIMYIFFMPTVSLLDALTVKMASAVGASYSAIRLWGSVGFCISLTSIGFLFDRINGVSGLLWVFLPIWFGVMVMFLVMREPKTESNIAREEVSSSTEERTLNLRTIRKTLSNPTLLLFFVLIFLLAIPHRMNDGLLSIHLQQIGGTGSDISLAWTMAGVSEIIGFLIIGRMMQRYRMEILMFFVSLLYMLRWIISAWSDDPWVIIVLQASHAVTYVAVWVISIDTISKLLPKQMNATGQALLNMLFVGIGGIVGGSIGGRLQEAGGGPAMYSFGVACAALAALGFIVWIRRTRHSQPKQGASYSS